MSLQDLTSDVSRKHSYITAMQMNKSSINRFKYLTYIWWYNYNLNM